MRAAVLGAALAFALALAPHAARAAEPLTLERAVAIVRAHNPNVEAQRGQAAAAGARVQQASAGFLPFLTGSFAYIPQTPNYAPPPGLLRVSTRGAKTITDGNGQPVVVSCPVAGTANCALLPFPPITNTLVSYWTAGVGIGWIPWDWGRSINAWRGARSLAASSELGVVTAQRNAVLSVKIAFFAVIAAARQVTVGEESVATFTAQLAQTRALHDAGLRTGIDVATAESSLAAAELTLTRARAGLATARAGLTQALGEETPHDWQPVLDPAEFELGPGDDARAALSEPALTDLAFQQRTELRQLDLIGRGFGQQAQAQRGQYLPALQLNLGPTWAGLDLSGMTRNFSITVALTYPPGGMSPFLVHGQVGEAEGNLTATLAQARAERDQIRQETASARALLASARGEVLAARELVMAATAQRDLAVGRYKTGIGTIIELDDALFGYVNARFQLVQAGYDLASARAQLDHAVGDDR
jgi:outer membrane protein